MPKSTRIVSAIIRIISELVIQLSSHYYALIKKNIIKDVATGVCSKFDNDDGLEQRKFF
jgi:hypothetical protein